MTTDLAPLAGLQNLTTFDYSFVNGDGKCPKNIEKLTQIKNLIMRYDDIEDISALKSMTSE